MASKKKSSKRTKTKAKRRKRSEEREERRFVPERSNAAILTMAGAIVGGLAIGIGGYGQLLSDPRVAAAPWTAAGGAVVLAAVILWGDMQGTAIRVGDGGVALERQGKVGVRVPWCDMREVVVKDGTVRVESEPPLSFSVASHPLAAAWVAKEAKARIPKRLKTDKGAEDALPKTRAGDGERLEVEPRQITGRECRASGRAITFERDARFCDRCGEIYHKDEMPDACLTCGANLDGG